MIDDCLEETLKLIAASLNCDDNWFAPAGQDRQAELEVAPGLELYLPVYDDQD